MTNNKKQTAVDYLLETICGDKSYYNRFTNDVIDYINHAHEKAKAMEREQIEEAFMDSSWFEHDDHSNESISTQYYNATYKGSSNE